MSRVTRIKKEDRVPPVTVQLIPPTKTQGYTFIRGKKASTIRYFTKLNRLPVSVQRTINAA